MGVADAAAGGSGHPRAQQPFSPEPPDQTVALSADRAEGDLHRSARLELHAQARARSLTPHRHTQDAEILSRKECRSLQLSEQFKCCPQACPGTKDVE